MGLAAVASGFTQFTRTIESCVRPLIQFGIPETLIYISAGIGDALMASALARALQLQRRRKIWLMSNGSALFGDENDGFALCTPDRPKFAAVLGRLGTDVRRPGYGTQGLGEEPMMVQLLRSGGFRGTALLKPFLNLDDRDLALVPREVKEAGGNVIVMHSTARAARYQVESKEWYPARFAEVARQLRAKGFQVVQLGSPTDPSLGDVMDLRGKTTLRQSAAIMSQARLFVGLEGFFVHLARAVGRRSVVVLGGRTRWFHFGYPCNVHLSTELNCTGCFLQTPCPNSMRCMDEIQVNAVMKAVDEVLARGDQPLETLEAQIDDGSASVFGDRIQTVLDRGGVN